MVERPKDLRDYLDFIKRRKYHIFIPWGLIFITVTVVALLLPPVYRSSTTILIEEQLIPPELVRSTVTGFIDERIKAITQQIMSRPRLLGIINQLGLYADLRDKYTTEEIIERMREDISLETISADVIEGTSRRPTTATIAFTVSYQGKDPVKVQNVANILASLYLEENLRNREERAKATTQFLEEELARLRKLMEEQEQKIAAFKEKHIGELPELMQLNLQTEQQLRRQIDSIEQQIRTLEDRKVYLEGQLSTVEPDTPLVDSNGRRLLDSKEKLRLLRTEYVSMAAHYSEKHPDLIRLKKEIERLEKVVGDKEDLLEKQRELEDKKSQLERLKATYSDLHPDVIKLRREIEILSRKIEELSKDNYLVEDIPVKPENPAYINLMTQITSTKLEIESLKKQKADLMKKWNEYIKRLENTPRVEKEYIALKRDYDNAKAKYQETMDKLLEAKRAEELEEKQGGEKFTIIDPAQYPEKPYKPNRLLIIMIGLVLGMGCGIGFASVVEYMDHSVRRPETLVELTATPVLTVIPKIITPEEKRRTRRRRLLMIAAVVTLLALGLVAVHYLVIDLNILWLKINRRLDLSVYL